MDNVKRSIRDARVWRGAVAWAPTEAHDADPGFLRPWFRMYVDGELAKWDAKIAAIRGRVP